MVVELDNKIYTRGGGGKEFCIFNFQYWWVLIMYSSVFHQDNGSLLCAFSLKATYLLPQPPEVCPCSLLTFPLRVFSISAGKVPSALWTNWQEVRIFSFGRERACSPGKALQGNCFLRDSSPHLWQPSPETNPFCC